MVLQREKLSSSRERERRVEALRVTRSVFLWLSEEVEDTGFNGVVGGEGFWD